MINVSLASILLWVVAALAHLTCLSVSLSVCPQDHLVSVLGVASTIAHELGHNLGMSHDTAERRCSCHSEPRLGGCIMEPSTGSVLPPTGLWRERSDWSLQDSKCVRGRTRRCWLHASDREQVEGKQ